MKKNYSVPQNCFSGRLFSQAPGVCSNGKSEGSMCAVDAWQSKLHRENRRIQGQAGQRFLLAFSSFLDLSRGVLLAYPPLDVHVRMYHACMPCHCPVGRPSQDERPKGSCNNSSIRDENDTRLPCMHAPFSCLGIPRFQNPRWRLHWLGEAPSDQQNLPWWHDSGGQRPAVPRSRQGMHCQQQSTGPPGTCRSTTKEKIPANSCTTVSFMTILLILSPI